MATLVIKPPYKPSRRELLQGDELKIGRASDNDISIVDPSVSRVHACLVRAGAGYEIRDEGSRNGVLVNDRRISSPTAIRPGDRILLGDVEIEVESDESRGGAGGLKLGDAHFEMSPASTMILSHAEAPSDLATSLTPDEDTLERRVAVDSAKLLAFFEEVTHAVIEQRPFEEVLAEILRHSLDIIREADRACLILMENGRPTPMVARHRDGRAVTMEVSHTVVRRVTESHDSVLSFNAQEDRRFAATESVVSVGICSVMCVPLITQDQVLGVLYVDTLSPVKRFTPDELKIFSALGNIAAGHLQRQQLLEESIERRVLAEQMKAAAATQRRLLEFEPPTTPGYEFHLVNRPCWAVGGDYVDLLDCGDKLLLVLGDVCGKGIDAALLMATLQAAVHAQVKIATDVKQIAVQVNRYLHDRTAPEKFATLFMGCLEPATGRLAYANAGHDPPLLVRHGRSKPERLQSTGPLAGAFEDSIYVVEAAETTLEPGDLLVVFTDGLHEAESPAGEAFGERRLIRWIVDNRDLEVGEIAAGVEQAVLHHSAGSEQQDDMTQLLVRRLRGGG